MVDLEQSEEQLEQEVQDLRYQLEIAKETLRAIGNGEVDALVIAGLEGEQVYTLQGADSSYRMLVEEMKEVPLPLPPIVHYYSIVIND